MMHSEHSLCCLVMPESSLKSLPALVFLNHNFIKRGPTGEENDQERTIMHYAASAGSKTKWETVRQLAQSL